MPQHGSTSQPIRTSTSLMALVPIWDSGEQTLLLSGNRTFQAGRGRDCDLIIRHPGVGALHATLRQTFDNVTVQPEDAHPVCINDRPIAQAAPIVVGDQVAFGPATFRVEARRGVRRHPRPGNSNAPSADISERLEHNLNQLQEQFEPAGQETAGPDQGEFDQLVRALSGPPPQLPQQQKQSGDAISEATPYLDGMASSNRSHALDERETQLNAWHESLDHRREELDLRSANLTRQQTALTARQTDLDHKTLELETWHASALEDIEARKRDLNSVAEGELQQQSAALEEQQNALQQRQEVFQLQQAELTSQQKTLNEERQELDQRREELTSELQQLEQQKQDLAAERTMLDAAQAQLQQNQSKLDSERLQFTQSCEAQRETDNQQQAALEQERQQLDEMASRLAQDRDALRQQEEDLRVAQRDLESLKAEVAEAEQQLAREEDASKDLTFDEAHPHPGAITVARHLLEEQKSSLDDQQDTIQTQLDALKRREAELDWLRDDLEAQRSLLFESQVEMEFEREEAALAFEEAQRLQQDFENARESLFADDVPSTVDDQAPKTENDNASDAVAQASAELLEELNRREQELQERTEELAQRVADVKAINRELKARQEQLDTNREPESAPQPASKIAAQLSSLLMPGVEAESAQFDNSATDEQLEAVQQEAAALLAERDALVEKVSDLENQLEDATQENLNVSALLPGGVFETTSKALTEHRLLEELQSLKSELEDSQEDGLDNASREGEQAVVQSKIGELEARNEELTEAHAAEIQRYQETIDQLTEQLELVRQQFEDLEQRALKSAQEQGTPAESSEAVDEEQNINGDSASESEAIDKLKEMVQQLSEKLEQRNNTIDNLQAQLNGGVPADPSLTMSPQEMRVQQQELDGRTVVLDEREEAIRERERLLEQQEQELQTQRVALQEARQQLEVARAEMQIHQPDVSESMLVSRDLIDSVAELAETGAAKPEPSLGDLLREEKSVEPTKEEPTEDTAAPERSSVRSEIAELFGLGSKTLPPKEEKEEVTPEAESSDLPSTAAEMMQAVDDYSQEAEAAVSLSFESAQDMLAQPEPAEQQEEFADDSAAESDSEGEGDDVVASYMEQLLARSRAKANGEAPEELKKAEPKKKEEPKKKPGSTSFIEQYMAGDYEGSPEDAPQTEEPPASAEDRQKQVDQSAELRRSKIDRDALRNDLQSFRELSTKSAENALATHARRQQKGGITTRTTIVTALAFICVLMLSAALMGVIPFGWMTTLSVLSVIVAGGELAFKLKKVKEEVEQKSQIAAAARTSAAAVPPAVPGETVSEPPVTEPASSDLFSDEPAAQAEPVISSQQENPAEEKATSVLPSSMLAEQPQSSSPSTPDDLSENTEAEDSAASVSAPEAANNEVTSQPEAEADVPDVFDQAFKMLTATSIPVKPKKEEDENV